MHRPVRLALATMAATAVLTLVGAPGASAYAPADTATIHPGVQTYTEGAQCTANFVFTDGVDTYIGQAAHCSGLGAATDTDGCLSESLPLGTPVEIDGAEHPGSIAYSSWITMRRVGETDPDACAYNDFALIKLDPRDVDNVNPSIPHWGGPTGLNTTGTDSGETVYSYGNSSLRLGATLLSPKVGTSNGTEGNGWTHVVNTVTPGIPGDSGSAFLDSEGRALGVLSTLGVGVPSGVVNNVSDLNLALEYLRTHETGALASVALVQGDEAFSPDQVPLDTDDPGDPVGGLLGLLGA